MTQFVVGSPFDDATVVEDEDLIGVGDRRQAVGDHERGAPTERFGECLLHMSLVFGVEMTRRLIEDHDRRILQQHAGNGEPLLLATRQSVAALADNGVVPLGEFGDHVMDACCFACGDQFVVGCVGSGVPKVVTDLLVEEMWILADNTDRLAQRVLGDRPNIETVDRDCPRGDVVEAGHERRHGGLAGTGWPDDRHHLTGCDVDIDPP